MSREPAGPRRRRHVLAGPVAGDVPVLAGGGDDRAVRGGAGRQRFDRRRPGGGRGRARRHPRRAPAATSATAGRPTSGAQGATAPWLLIANPDVRWCEPGALDALLAAGERWPQGRRVRPGHRDPRWSAVSECACVALARARHRSCACRLVVADESVDRRPTGRSGNARRGRRAAGCRARPCWCAGKRSRQSAASTRNTSCTSRTSTSATGSARAGWTSVYVPSAVVEHTGGHATSAGPALMQRAHHASAYRYLADRYRGRALAAGADGAARRAAGALPALAGLGAHG